MFCISFVYLLLHVTYMQDFKKKSLPAKLLLVQNLAKMAHCLNQQQQKLDLTISYIPLLSVMTLHYHRLYQISSLEANLSLQDMKQLCR